MKLSLMLKYDQDGKCRVLPRAYVRREKAEECAYHLERQTISALERFVTVTNYDNDIEVPTYHIIDIKTVGRLPDKKKKRK